MRSKQQSLLAVCQCGKTAIELTGGPIQSVVCHCNSCRTAGHQFEREPGAPKTVNAEEGVDYCLFRKDRVKIAKGGENLREHRLKPHSPTRRVVASCCNTPMFADFTRGHWLSIYRDRLAGQAPEPKVRVMAKDQPQGSPLPDGIPAYGSFPPLLMVKLLATWAAMGFRRPTI